MNLTRLDRIKRKLMKSGIRKDNVESIQELIEKEIPSKIEKTPSDIKYENMRKWKRSADLDSKDGKQTVGPINFKGSPSMDKRLAQIDRRNSNIDRAIDDIVGSNELETLRQMTKKYDDRKKLMKPLRLSANKFENLGKLMNSERSMLYREVEKELQKERESIAKEFIDLPLGIKRDDPRAVELRRRLVDANDKEEYMNEAWKRDENDFRIKSDPFAHFEMTGTPEGRYFGGHGNYDWDHMLPNDVVNKVKDASKSVINVPIPSGNDMPSPQKFIRRFHTTKVTNVPSIFKEGLDPKYSGTGYGDQISSYADPNAYNGVYTIAETPWLNVKRGKAYYPDQDEITFEMMIPKEEYLKIPRRETNVEDEITGVDKGLQTVQKGGRTDIFQGKLKPEWIVNAYDHKLRPVDFNHLKDKKSAEDLRRYWHLER